MSAGQMREKVMACLRSESASERLALVEDIRALAIRRRITYEYDKSTGEEPIRILLPPVFLDAGQISALHRVCLILSRACEKALGLYLAHEEARVLFPLEEDERRLIEASRPDCHVRRPAVWQRIDATLDPASPAESLRFMETNMNSVGGVYYGPAVEKLVLESILPRIMAGGDHDSIHPNEDPEKMLFDLFMRHAAGLAREPGARPLRIAIVENDPDATGCTESPAVAEGLCSFGAEAFLARPEEFEVRGEALRHGGRDVDLVYRLFEVREMNEMGGQAALSAAFAANRVVSGLGGEFDHKSIFELFTSSAFVHFFSPEERSIFRKHVLWTRLLRETSTDSPSGARIDLPAYAHASKDALVLKPNRSYGGDNIVIGRDADTRAWQSAVETAMKSGGAVVQAYCPLTEMTFPVIGPAGEFVNESLHVVFGFSTMPDGLGIIGRASRSSVVNVARHGGLVPVLRVGT